MRLKLGNYGQNKDESFSRPGETALCSCGILELAPNFSNVCVSLLSWFQADVVLTPVPTS